tara:strand:+ start:19021 stop:19785 length:765 start_codon:yes stop_codon:yes gene_type:complete
MFKFFRSVRQVLLSENKFSKYLLYALGEILLVVIGILIALQINNWNEQQKAQLELNAILIEVYNDLNSDLKELQRRTVFYENFIDNIHILQERHTALSGDSLALRISNLHRVASFNPVQFGYTKLNSNPNTGLISSNLVATISDYYTTFGQNSINNTNSEFLSTYSLNLFRDFLIPYGFPISEAFKFELPISETQVFRAITKEKEFWGIVRNMEYNWGIQQFGIEEARTKAHANLNLLEEYFTAHEIEFQKLTD